MTKKILVTNRGETTMRISRAYRVVNIATVAIYIHADRDALHVRYAEEAYCTSGSPEDTSYLKPGKILQIAKETGAAIYPGYNFSPENIDFARRYEEKGVIFIGPSANITVRTDIKIGTRQIMRKASLPTVPDTGDPMKGITEAREVVAEVGYPTVLKVLVGGGGKGARLVYSEEEMGAILHFLRPEAGTSFGNDAAYIEGYIENPYHIEVQILGDKYGNVIHLYECECSIQWRNQKVTEESPSPSTKPEIRVEILKVAMETCKRINYYSAGTLESTMDKDQNLYFLEMDIRLQVEHPAAEEYTGVDLVRGMIPVAAGDRPSYRQEDIEFRGTAIEYRICVEDPGNNSMPLPGVITVREAPRGRNVRLDSAVYAGLEVFLYYDPMIAELCCWGCNRGSAISSIARALREYRILDIKTTIPFHQHVLKDTTFLKGECDTTFVDTRFDKEDLKRGQNTNLTVAMIAAVPKHYEEEREAVSRTIMFLVAGGSL